MSKRLLGLEYFTVSTVPMNPVVPTHHRIAERIARLGKHRGTDSHSILIYGPLGAGQREVAQRFGQSIFCETGNGPFGACGKCRNCRRVVEGTHPDWIWLEPQKKERGLPNITIESVRDLKDRLVLEPFEGEKVVGCIFEAEKMKPETANSLLKLVEEPPAHAQFILVTENRQRILPTIRSRCLPVPLGPPTAQTLVSSLVEQEGWNQEQAVQAVLWSLNEGITPDETLSEERRSLREESLALMNAAVENGEYAFFPMLRSLKAEREAMALYLRFFRDYLKDTLLVESGKEEMLTYRPFRSRFASWGRKLNPADIADLIDQSLDFEEALMGYANPTHTLGTFLSQVASRAETEIHEPPSPH